MVDRVQAQSDALLVKWDDRVGKSATYIQVGTPTVDVDTGVSTPNHTSIPGIQIRHMKLSTLDISRFTQAGLAQVETAFRMRHAYVAEASKDDQLLLTVSQFRYEIISATLDALELDWTLLTRRMRV